ncbi:glycerate kinase [Desulfococcaceae bacterium HSG8]|nr:glycerate kinase [Desulfococcaceae bacterium HSG8]
MTIFSDNLAKMREHALSIFQAGLKAVEPGAAIRRYCRPEGETLFIKNIPYDLSRFRKLFLIGAGKASAPMAKALEDMVGEKIAGGIVNVKYGHVDELRRVRLSEGGHPVPDENGEKGAQAIYNLVKQARKDDLILCVISGGGSALLPLPFRGITLKDKQDTANVLLACGATIHEINAIRKHMSVLKGGGLAQAAAPAALVSLILSDVVGDDTDVIASGPTVPDTSTFRDCLAILEKYKIADRVPASVLRHIREGRAGNVPETPKKGARIFDNTQNVIIGNNADAIIAAKQKAETLGYTSLILSSMIEGETKHIAKVHSAIAREVLKTGHPVPAPACILSGGETTVTITGKGLGGRNQEFALWAASDIAGRENIVVFSGGTDGNDGPTDAAGAVADNCTVERARAIGVEPVQFLSNNDSYHFFEKLGDLLITGPTNTNVMDIRIMLVV